MEIRGLCCLRAPREKVWEALNDADFLQNAIPGCLSMEKVSNTEFAARVNAKIGSVSTIFDSRITLTDLNPPESYILVGEGKGGAIGFAKGRAHVHLTNECRETILRYEGELQVGGKLARIGNRLVHGVAKRTADEFLASFSTMINEAASIHELSSVTPPMPPSSRATTPETEASASGLVGLLSNMRPVVWFGMAVVVAILFWVAF